MPRVGRIVLPGVAYHITQRGNKRWQALRYIERNPRRARLVRQAAKYRWSSAGEHAGVRAPGGLVDLSEWERQMGPAAWREELTRPQSDEEVGAIRSHTHTGRPLASDSFLSKLERALGRRLRPMPVGRPAKAKGRRRNR